MSGRDPLLSFLCTRNLVMRAANMPLATDENLDEGNARATALESLMMATPAVTLEGFAAKLMLQIEISVEGFEVNMDDARALIREGRDRFGIGDFITPELEGTD